MDTEVKEKIKIIACLIAVGCMAWYLWTLYNKPVPVPDKTQYPQYVYDQLDKKTKDDFGRKVSYSIERCYVGRVYSRVYIVKER
jgi:hypothetical protein